MQSSGRLGYSQQRSEGSRQAKYSIINYGPEEIKRKESKKPKIVD
jgi:hypothetical protein